MQELKYIVWGLFTCGVIIGVGRVHDKFEKIAKGNESIGKIDIVVLRVMVGYFILTLLFKTGCWILGSGN